MPILPADRVLDGLQGLSLRLQQLLLHRRLVRLLNYRLVRADIISLAGSALLDVLPWSSTGFWL